MQRGHASRPTGRLGEVLTSDPKGVGAKSLSPMLALALPALASAAAINLDLGGANSWRVRNATMSAAGVPATVPGQIHSDLLAAGLIGEPYNASNQEGQKWVALTNWTYTRSFDASAALLAKQHVQLVSLGLDTIASVAVNGKPAFDSDNMFQRLRVPVKHLLVAGANTITVAFSSKVAAAQAGADACEVNTSTICPYRRDNPVQHGWDNANFIRTEPCSFSWDWGPAFAPVGLWRPIALEGFDGAVVRDVLVEALPASRATAAASGAFEAADAFAANDTSDAAMVARAHRRTDRELNLDAWDLQVTVFVDGGVLDCAGAALAVAQAAAATTASGATVTGTVSVTVGGTAATAQKTGVVVGAGAEVAVEVKLSAVQAKAWWPNGFGAQNLHNVTATFTPDAAAADTASLTVRTGFRQVELVQDPLPGGRSFFFRVNGVPVPVKGSNWIPADAFESRVTRDTLAPLFHGLRDSYQNMVRNWGGGIYQSEAFYDLADENGIMIWEDMMFACADYAVPDAFLKSVAKEVVDQTRRLQRRPSIVLWAGNNENENKKPSDTTNVKAYSDLYFRTVLANISALDGSRPLTGSSPSNGNETAAAPFAWDDQSEFYGDVHCYLYDVDNWDVTAFKRPRFMSEFGLQSWPSALTLAGVFPPDQQKWGSDLMTNRNHHPQGQEQMIQQISMHFHLPREPWWSHSTPALEKRVWAQYLWLSQLNQALGYKVEVEHFRRIRTECDAVTPGCNMGRMYWQTNDIWQGASWAAMDYTGRYKMVQYYTKKFYAPTLVSGYCVHWQDCAVYFVNDLVDGAVAPADGVLKLSLHSWNEGKLVEWDVPFSADPASAKRVWNGTQAALLARANGKGEHGCSDATKCILVMQAYNGSSLLSQNELLLSPSMNVVTTMMPPQLAASVGPPRAEPWLDDASGGAALPVFDVTLTAQHVPVAFAWLETPFAGHWSDNGFIMTEKSVTLQFFSREPQLTQEALQKNLVLSDLSETSPEYGTNNGWPKL